ncbi:cytidylyltransferase domain-containing protein [Halocola ammonii]
MKSFIVQARTGSTRMPGKTLLPLWNEMGMLELILQYLAQAFPEIGLVVATTTNSDDDQIEELCNKLNVKCFRGDEQNVLKRMVDAARFHEVDDIVRVCSDNPFLQKKFIKLLIDDTSGADYVTCTVNGTPTIITHFGFFVERVKRKALELVQKITVDPLYQEHVTNYVYQHPDDFELKFIEVEDELGNLKNTRFTVDDESDFLRAKKIFSTFDRFPDLSDLKQFISHNPSEKELMKKTIEKYQK